MSLGGATWLGDLEASVDEIARTALGMEGSTVRARTDVPRPLDVAFIGLVGPGGGIQIGLGADPAGCETFARGLLGMPAGGEPLPGPEIADAMCEIINIVAGAFKGRVRDRASPLQMGLPVFIHGSVQATDHTAVRVAEVTIGAVEAVVVLVHPRAGGPG